MRESMEGLLHDAKVDAVFNGHVHSYERTKPVYNLEVCSLCIVCAMCYHDHNHQHHHHRRHYHHHYYRTTTAAAATTTATAAAAAAAA